MYPAYILCQWIDHIDQGAPIGLALDDSLIMLGNRQAAACSYRIRKGGDNNYCMPTPTSVQVHFGIIKVLPVLFISVITGIILSHQACGQSHSHHRVHLVRETLQTSSRFWHACGHPWMHGFTNFESLENGPRLNLSRTL
jgi:hypothetical protein